MNLAEWLAAKEERKAKRPGLAGMSRSKQDEKAELLQKFHRPVIARDGGDCVYCALFFGRARPATHGEHLLTQYAWPELIFCTWVGAATCRSCNTLRDMRVLQACIVANGAGVIQCTRHKIETKNGVDYFTPWYGRLLTPSAGPDGYAWKGKGDGVGEFHELPAEEAERLDLRNNVLIGGMPQG